MAEALPYAVAAVAVIAVWFAGLAWLDIFTPQDLRAWRRLAALRGYAAAGGRLERFARRTRLAVRLQQELDLHRLLAVAGRGETPAGFLAVLLCAGLLAAAALTGAELAYRAATGGWLLGAGPWTGMLALPLVPVGLLLALRRAAHRRQERAGRALGDMMMLVAILTDGRGLQLEDAVRILARCLTGAELATLVEGEGWRPLVERGSAGTIDLYRMIATAYGIPAFATVADAAANANLGFSERETYTAVARGVYAQRLADARMRAARAKTLVTLPIAAMLLPLLVLLGAPAVSTITGGLAGR